MSYPNNLSVSPCNTSALLDPKYKAARLIYQQHHPKRRITLYKVAFYCSFGAIIALILNASQMIKITPHESSIDITLYGTVMRPPFSDGKSTPSHTKKNYLHKSSDVFQSTTHKRENEGESTNPTQSNGHSESHLPDSRLTSESSSTLIEDVGEISDRQTVAPDNMGFQQQRSENKIQNANTKVSHSNLERVEISISDDDVSKRIATTMQVDRRNVDRTPKQPIKTSFKPALPQKDTSKIPLASVKSPVSPIKKSSLKVSSKPRNSMVMQSLPPVQSATALATSSQIQEQVDAQPIDESLLGIGELFADTDENDSDFVLVLPKEEEREDAYSSGYHRRQDIAFAGDSAKRGPENFSLAVSGGTSLEKKSPKLRGKLAIFLHIHKAGGTTMCVMAHYNNEKSLRKSNCNVNDHVDRRELIQGNITTVDRILEKYRVQENYTFLANEWMLPAEIPARKEHMYLTMLRNPLARMESHFFMAMSQLKQGYKRSISKMQCLFTRGMRGAPIPSVLDLQRLETNLKVAASARQYFAMNTPDNWQTRSLCGPACAEVPFGMLTEEHLELAKYRLASHFTAVGILEHFKDSITLFHHILHWRRDVSKLFNSHHGTHHKGLTVLETIEKASMKRPKLLTFAKWFHAVNIYDIQLYNFGRTLFQKQAALAGIEVTLGPNLPLDYIAPNGEITSVKDLTQMLTNSVRFRKCHTQCCRSLCAPIGRFWVSTALKLNLVPPRPLCSLGSGNKK